MGTSESQTRRTRWRPRITVGALMLVVALLALLFAWVADRAKQVAVVDLGPPDLIAVGDRQHSLASLQGYIRASRVKQVVIRVPNNMPYNSLMTVVQAIEAGGLHQIQFSTPAQPPNPALRRTPNRRDGDAARR